MINLVLFGPPGAGKGTQSQKLAEHFNLVHISTGDLFRNEIKNQTELGTKAKALIDKGELVPDVITVGMVDNKINSNKDAKGFIFDGFPRTNAQAAALDVLLEKHHTAITIMLELTVEEGELIKRLLLRGKDSGRTDDQDEDIIKNRIAVYKRETAPVADFYKAQNKYEAVEGVGEIDDIFNALKEQLEKAS